MNLVETYRKVKPTVYALAIEQPVPNSANNTFKVFGSAVCIHSSGLFLTAKHCLVSEGGEALDPTEYCLVQVPTVLEGGNLRTLIGKVSALMYDHVYDIAFLQIACEKGQIFDSIEVANNTLEEGQEVGCAGYPITNKERIVFPNLLSGIISRIDYRTQKNERICWNMVLDLSAHKGNSGGPVFNDQGKLIGIVSFQELRETDTQIDKYPKNVWTNLIHCVPFTVFGSIEDIKSEFDRGPSHR